MQTSRTTSFIESKDLALNRYSRVGLSRAWVIKKSSRKASNASTLFTHNSKEHENAISPGKTPGDPSSERKPPQLRRSLSILAKAWLYQLWRPYRPNCDHAHRVG